jgi:hypothetical protein
MARNAARTRLMVGDHDLSPAASAALEAFWPARPRPRVYWRGTNGKRKRKRRRRRAGRHAIIAAPALAALGHDEGTLAGLVEDGWLVRWPLGGDVLRRMLPQGGERFGLRREQVDPKASYDLLTLSPWGAERVARMIAETSSEVPYWAAQPPPRAKGEPAPRPRPLMMPTGYRTRRLPDWSMVDAADPRPGPVQEAIDHEEYLVQQAVSETGEPVRDETGTVVIAPLLCQGPKVPTGDGLKGGLSGRHDGRIPVDRRIRGKRPKA